VVSKLSKNASRTVVEQEINNALREHKNIYDLCGVIKNPSQLKSVLDYLIASHYNNPTLQKAIYSQLSSLATKEGVHLNLPIARRSDINKDRTYKPEPIIERFKEGRVESGKEVDFEYTEPFYINLGKQNIFKIERGVDGFIMTAKNGDMYPLSRGKTVMGRDSNVSNIIIDSDVISGKHATITIEGNRVSIKDNNSTNGTSISRSKNIEVIDKFRGGRIEGGKEVGFEYAEPFNIRLGKEVVLKINRDANGFYLTEANGSAHTLPQGEILVGREFEANNIAIQDVTVSSQHLKIIINGNRITIKDSNSTNGTSLERGD